MRANQVVFAVSSRADGGVDVLLGVPTAAWEYMQDGKTHTFDLTKLGLSIRLIMCGGKDQAQLRGWIDEHNKRLGVTEVQDRRG